jgi:hypothetical protein
VVPAGHTHFDASHACVDVHASPQPPQLSGSAVVSTQLSPHVVNGMVQVATHAPL